MSRADRPDDVQRAHWDRLRRSAELPKPVGAYDVHEAAWQWAERMRSLRSEPWSAYGRLWNVGKEKP